MPFTNIIKDLFSFPKLHSIFLHHFLVFGRRFLKEMLFLAHFGTHFGTQQKLKALTQATYVQNIKFVGVVVFEYKWFEAIVEGNGYLYQYERPCHKDRRRNSSVLKRLDADYLYKTYTNQCQCKFSCQLFNVK
jgi:hypothetical protein